MVKFFGAALGAPKDREASIMVYLDTDNESQAINLTRLTQREQDDY